MENSGSTIRLIEFRLQDRPPATQTLLARPGSRTALPTSSSQISSSVLEEDSLEYRKSKFLFFMPFDPVEQQKSNSITTSGFGKLFKKQHQNSKQAARPRYPNISETKSKSSSKPGNPFMAIKNHNNNSSCSNLSGLSSIVQLPPSNLVQEKRPSSQQQSSVSHQLKRQSRVSKQVMGLNQKSRLSQGFISEEIVNTDRQNRQNSKNAEGKGAKSNNIKSLEKNDRKSQKNILREISNIRQTQSSQIKTRHSEALPIKGLGSRQGLTTSKDKRNTLRPIPEIEQQMTPKPLNFKKSLQKPKTTASKDELVKDKLNSSARKEQNESRVQDSNSKRNYNQSSIVKELEKDAGDKKKEEPVEKADIAKQVKQEPEQQRMSICLSENEQVCECLVAKEEKSLVGDRLNIQPQKKVSNRLRYSDLYLSGDLLSMSSMEGFKSPGSKDPRARESVRCCETTLIANQFDSKQQKLEQQLKQVEKKLENQNQTVAANREIILSQHQSLHEEHFKKLNSHISETQDNIQKMLKNTLEELDKRKQVTIEETGIQTTNQKSAPGQSRKRAPIVEYLEISQQIRQLYTNSIPAAGVLYKDNQFDCQKATQGSKNPSWIQIDKIPGRPEKVQLFGKDGSLGQVISNSPETDTLCMILNTVASISPLAITRLFQEFDETYNSGLVGVWLFTEGEFNPVLLDCSLPFSQSLDPLYIYNRDPAQLWPQYLCKAIVKVIGSYSKLCLLTISEILTIVTGIYPRTLCNCNNKEVDAKVLWKDVSKLIDNGCVVLAQQGQVLEKPTSISYIHNTKSSSELQIRTNNHSQITDVTNVILKYAQLTAVNLSHLYRHHYSRINLARGNTYCTDFNACQKMHIYFQIYVPDSPNSLPLGIYLYRVETEQILRLVGSCQARQEPGILQYQANLRKGKYKLFLIQSQSAQEQKQETSDVNRSMAHTSLHARVNEAKTFQICLGVISKEPVVLTNPQVLKREGNWDMGNSSLSYKPHGKSNSQINRTMVSTGSDFKNKEEKPQNKKKKREESLKKKQSENSHRRVVSRHEVRFKTNTTIGHESEQQQLAG